MKTVFFLTVLTLSLVSIATAGLDTESLFNRVIAVYDFESTGKQEELVFIEDSGPQQLPATLLNGASLAPDGKSGQCISLESLALVGSGTRLVPLFARFGFSIVAWVKRPQQDGGVVIGMSASQEIVGEEVSTGLIALGVTPSGNIKGTHTDHTTGESLVLPTQEQNVSDNQWHHIAYVLFADTYTLFIDGEAVLSQPAVVHPGFLGDLVLLTIVTSPENDQNTLVDEVGFFETGFSAYEIKGLYEDGLETFLEVMPVEPQGKLATTWGAMKKDRW
jgi:hypothetical protein